VYEIKTSASGLSIDPDQLKRLKALTRHSTVRLVRPEQVFKSGAWVTLKRVRNTIRLLELIGLTAAAWNVINYDRFDDQFEALHSQILYAKSRTDPNDKLVQTLKALTMMRDYMSNFVPESLSLNILYGMSVMRTVADWEN
jgi:hypothetical protein